MASKPTILVIFGISGDLSRRYLLPAIEAIAKANMLLEKFHILGITRKRDLKISDILDKNSEMNYVREHLDLYQMDVAKGDEYKKLDEYISRLESSFEAPGERIFYLSVPPEACKPIVEFIGESGLQKKTQSKLLLEKPFGKDLSSAKDLIKHIDKYFKEDEVYRIDHYMAKEAAQNIIVFRDGNSLFKKTWNKDFVESVEVIVSEAIGIEGRAHFYEQTGALRDYVPNHLLQLLALVLMDLPKRGDLDKVPSLRLEALKHLSVVDFKRGQYEGYKDEVRNSDTEVETFVSLSLKSDDPKWHGVPMVLSTGKALESRFTEVRVHYKKNEKHESNELILRIQPDAGIKFSVWAKRPGYERELSPHVLSFNFKDYYKELPEAYEQVLFNALNSDRSLFTSSGEILESWRVVDPVQKAWEKGSGNLLIYSAGGKIEEIIAKAELSK